MSKDDLTRSLVLRKFHAVFPQCRPAAACISLFDLNDSRSLFAETLIRESDDRNILDRLIRMQEVFDLRRINIFTAGNNDILLAVYQIVEAVLVALCHIACIEPSFNIQNFSRSNRIIKVAGHDTRTINGEFSDLLALSSMTFLSSSTIFACQPYPGTPIAPTLSIFSTPRCTQPGPIDSDRP